MKILLFSLVLLCGRAFSSLAQIPGAADSLRAQAGRLADALVKGDYKTVVHYAPSKLVQLMGGEDSAARKMAEEMGASEGISFEAARLDTLSKFVKCVGELQATIGQYTTLKMPTVRMEVSSTLICFSSDEGAHWTFIDTNRGDHMDEIKKVFPNICPDLHIPLQPPPRYINVSNN